jgi:hypothetical protein
MSGRQAKVDDARTEASGCPIGRWFDSLRRVLAKAGQHAEFIEKVQCETERNMPEKRTKDYNRGCCS